MTSQKVTEESNAPPDSPPPSIQSSLRRPAAIHYFGLVFLYVSVFTLGVFSKPVFYEVNSNELLWEIVAWAAIVAPPIFAIAYSIFWETDNGKPKPAMPLQQPHKTMEAPKVPPITDTPSSRHRHSILNSYAIDLFIIGLSMNTILLSVPYSPGGSPRVDAIICFLLSAATALIVFGCNELVGCILTEYSEMILMRARAGAKSIVVEEGEQELVVIRKGDAESVNVIDQEKSFTAVRDGEQKLVTIQVIIKDPSGTFSF